MLRKIAIGVGLVLTTGTVAHGELPRPVQVAVLAEGGACHEHGCGCGSTAEYRHSGLVVDLPGCDGDLPTGASAWDLALHEAKVALRQAQRWIDGEAADKADQAMYRADQAIALLATQQPGKDGSTERASAAEALSCHRVALSGLRVQAQLLPDLDDLRSCHVHAQVLLRQEPQEKEPPVQQSTVRLAGAVLARAGQCVALLRKLTAQKQLTGASMEVAPGRKRPLQDLLQDAEAGQRAAEVRLKVAEQERAVVRGRWLRVLFGDRLRVFNEHPDDLPDYDGKARGPLPASVAPRWHFQRPDGKIENFLFRRNRLISKTVEDARRS